MGEVILGMPGPWAEDYREESDHYTTKIGGLPDWPVRDVDVGLDVLNCGLRGERLCLVAQVYALVSTTKLNIEERVSYIFGCRMTKCGSNPRSRRAIRVQKCQDEKEIGGPKKEPMTLEEDSASISKRNNCHGEDLFSFGENDEDSDNDIDLEELGRVFSEPGTQASRSRKQNVSTHSKDARNALVSKPRPIDADTNKPEPAPKDNEEDERWEGENYEYDRALRADRTYLKFKKQLDSNPEQCFRAAVPPRVNRNPAAAAGLWWRRPSSSRMNEFFSGGQLHITFRVSL